MIEQDRPYIEPPPEKKQNGLICFMHPDRECGSDCMAFSVTAPSGTEYRGQWSCCRLLVGAHQVSKHLVILAQVTKASADDERRKAGLP